MLNAAESLYNLHRGSDKAHGETTLNGETSAKGKAEAKCETVKSPATPALFEKHLAGTQGLGVVTICEDDIVHWGAIDIDVYDLKLPELEQDVIKNNLPLIVVRTKSGGAHLYIYFSEPIPATVAQKKLEEMAVCLGYEGVEVFPKQKKLKPGAVGSWLNMPYFGGDTTNRYAIKDGVQLSVDEFIQEAMSKRLTLEAFNALNVPPPPKTGEDKQADPVKPNRSRGRKTGFVLPDEVCEHATPGRDTTMYGFGCHLKGLGVDDAQTLKMMHEANLSICKPPLAEDVVDEKFRLAVEFCNSPSPDWVQELNSKSFVSQECGKTAVYTDSFDPVMKRPLLLRSSPGDFVQLHSNKIVVVGTKPSGQLITDRLGHGWLNSIYRRQHAGIMLAPHDIDLPENYYNLWKGWSVKPVKGNWSRLRNHIFDNICSGNEGNFYYLMGWLASMFQFPSKQAEVAVVLKGEKGTGKTIAAKWFGAAFGENAMEISSAKHLVGNFNAHLRALILLIANEAFFAGDKSHEGVLKAIITDSTLTIEAKGRDVITCPNMLHLIMTSNSEYVVPASTGERRYFVLNVSDAHAQDTEYFGAIEAEMLNGGLAAMLYEFLHYDLTGFNIRKVPQTDALLEQKIHNLQNMEPITAWYFEKLKDGGLPGCDEWTDAVEKSWLYEDYIATTARAGGKNRAGETSFGMALQKLCPGIWPKSCKIKKTVRIVDIKGVACEFKRQIPHYAFPELDECRTFFEGVMKHKIDWQD